MSSLSIIVITWSVVLIAGVVYAAPPGVKDLPSVDQLPAVAELPNPFVFNDGSPVRTRDDWTRRRQELLAAIFYYQYGHLPPAPPSIAAREVSSKSIEALGAVEKEIVLSMADGRIEITVFLTIPAGKGPFPAIIRGDVCWKRLSEPIVANIIKRGYMLADFDRTQVAPDKNDRSRGIYVVYPEYDCAALAAWAWGFHRVVDYLHTRADVDKARIVATGHSRGGKAVLLAGATDQRIALTVPNNSGCGGAGCYRFQAKGSEDIAAILKNFPFWFHPRFRDFIGRVDRLPFDQHSLKALVAPRALLTTEALGDLWANPEGTQQTYLAAKEVFDFLGAGDRIGIYFREGKHEHNEADFNVLLDFADKVLFGRTVERRFDQLAFPDSPRAYSWKAPRPQASN